MEQLKLGRGGWGHDLKSRPPGVKFFALKNLRFKNFPPPLTSINPQNPNIIMHILHTVLHKFPEVLEGELNNQEPL